MRLPKQRNSFQCSLTFFCFESPTMCFLKLAAGQVLVFSWIAGSCCCFKQAQVVRKLVNRSTNFSCMQVFFPAFCVFWAGLSLSFDTPVATILLMGELYQLQVNSPLHVTSGDRNRSRKPYCNIINKVA